MINNSIFSVSRDDYKSFVEQIKPEYRQIETIDGRIKTITKIFSKETGKCLCSRISYREKSTPEKYFIFEMPEDYERRAPIPHMKLKLETKEEVQAFFDAVLKMQKEKNKND